MLEKLPATIRFTGAAPANSNEITGHRVVITKRVGTLLLPCIVTVSYPVVKEANGSKD